MAKCLQDFSLMKNENDNYSVFQVPMEETGSRLQLRSI